MIFNVFLKTKTKTEKVRIKTNNIKSIQPNFGNLKIKQNYSFY